MPRLFLTFIYAFATIKKWIHSASFAPEALRELRSDILAGKPDETGLWGPQ